MSLDSRLRSEFAQIASEFTYDYEADLGNVLRMGRRRIVVRRTGAALAGLALVAIALFSAPQMASKLGIQQIGTADQPGKTESNGLGPEGSSLGTAGEGRKRTDGGFLGSGAGLPIPGASPIPGISPGTKGSSSSKGVQSAGSHPPDADSPSFETAGPPVFYTDQADDAHGQDAPPNSALSQREFDILRVDWGPVSYVNEQSPGGYSTSMTIAGSARDDGQYVSWARFGTDCRVYHFLTPGTTAFANAFCDSSTKGGWMGFVGRVEGGPVTSTPTTSGGTRLTATFDNRKILPELEAAGRTLHNLSAFTCEGHVEPLGYCPGGKDEATSELSYRV